MFITSKINVNLPTKSGTQKVPANFLGDIDLDLGNWYVASLIKSGSIAICENRKDSSIEKAETESQAKVQKQVAESERKRAIDEAREAAKIEAEKQATEAGLDATATKKLIKEMQIAAVEALIAKSATYSG